jgi:hypothetical protein
MVGEEEVRGVQEELVGAGEGGGGGRARGVERASHQGRVRWPQRLV